MKKILIVMGIIGAAFSFASFPPGAGYAVGFPVDIIDVPSFDTLSRTGTPSGADLIGYRSITPPTLTAFGNSYIQANGSWPTYPDLLSTRMNWNLLNRGDAGGVAVADSQFIGRVYSTNPSEEGIYLNDIAANDIQASPPTTIADFSKTFAAANAWLAIPNSEKQTISSATFHGSWSTGQYGSKYSSTLNDYVEFTFTGTSVAIFSNIDTTGGAAALLVDGSPSGSITSKMTIANHRGVIVAPSMWTIHGFSNLVHTVRITVSQSGRKVYYTGSYGGTVGLREYPQVIAGGVSWFDTSRTGGTLSNLIPSFDASMDSCIAEMRHYLGLNVIRANYKLDSVGADFRPDGVHPADSGITKIVDSINYSWNSREQTVQQDLEGLSFPNQFLRTDGPVFKNYMRGPFWEVNTPAGSNGGGMFAQNGLTHINMCGGGGLIQDSGACIDVWGNNSAVPGSAFIRLGKRTSILGVTDSLGNIIAQFKGNAIRESEFKGFAAFDSTLLVGGSTILDSTLLVGGGSENPGTGIYQNNPNLRGVAQTGIAADPQINHFATASGYAMEARLRTLGGTPFTTTTGVGVQIDAPVLAASTTVTNLIGLNVGNQTAGSSSNRAIKTGSGPVEFGDDVILPTLTADSCLKLNGSNHVISVSCPTSAANLTNYSVKGRFASMHLSGNDTVDGDFQAATVLSTGNIGIIGAPPSTNALFGLWSGTASFMGQTGTSSEADIGVNFYYNSGFKRLVGPNGAARIGFGSESPYDSSGIYFYTAPAGAANSAISWNKRMYIDNTTGHIGITNDIPTLSSCGSSPAIATGSSDMAGEITEGSVATGCTITFAKAFASAPFCTVTEQAGLAASYTISTSAITITNIGALSSTKLNYQCFAH